MISMSHRTTPLTGLAICVLAICVLAIIGPSMLAADESGASRRSATAAQMAAAAARIDQAIRREPVDSPGQVVVVYFTPRDRPPAADHVARLGRIVDETARFYESELTRHGFAGRRLNVARDADGKVRVLDVVGEDLDQNYNGPDGQRIRQETFPALRQNGIDPDRSVLLLFCNLVDYDPVQSTIGHHSPYYGGGNHLSGTAWQSDSPILDPQRFRDRTPIRDGQYGDITIGRYNSIFIGGVVHELGHALSLPHCRERADERDRGTALMGSGNQTYAQELRSEGRGTFLTQAHAMRLAAHPVFNSSVASNVTQSPSITWPELKLEVTADLQIVVRGRLETDIPVHGVIGYFDPEGGSDYDATTATGVPDGQGRFEFQSGSLFPKKSPPNESATNRAMELRLTVCHTNGATSQRRLMLEFDGSGKPNLQPLRLQLELSSMIGALRDSGLPAAEAELIRLAGGDASLRSIGRRVLDRFADSAQHVWNADPIGSAAPANVDPSVTRIDLSRTEPQSARVGWLGPAYDRVPGDDKILSIGGDYFARGIYAHAPAMHRYDLGGRWTRLRGRCGLQGENFGRVGFVIQGDDQELWSAEKIARGPGAAFDLDVTGIGTLTLTVTDDGDGKAGDWGVWIEPTLSR